MRVLILGGTGTISTGITRILLDRGDEVTLFTRGERPHGFDAAAAAGQLSQIIGDRASAADLARAMDTEPFDAVIDMICFTADDARLIADAVAGRVPQLVFCSTVDVYTKPAPVFPVVESSERIPVATFPYAFAKKEAEDVLEAAAASGAFALTILRPAATYEGFAVPPVGSYPTYIARLRAGEPIIIHGDGSGIWVSCHRDDVAAAFVAALGNPLALNNAYTLAGSELVTWNAYWTTVAHALGVEPHIVHIPTELLYRAAPKLAEWCWMNFQYDNIYDSSRAEADLGFRMRRTWAEGVAGFDLDSVPDPDPAEAAEYDALVRAWQRHSDALTAELSTHTHTSGRTA